MVVGMMLFLETMGVRPLFAYVTEAFGLEGILCGGAFGMCASDVSLSEESDELMGDRGLVWGWLRGRGGGLYKCWELVQA